MSARTPTNKQRPAGSIGLRAHGIAAETASASRASAQRVGTDRPPIRNVHDFLANQLGTAIVRGAFPPGSLLPSEVTLRERFGVSRTALREAFRALSAKGLIVSRTKIGTRVRPKADWNMLDPDVLAWHLQITPTDDFVTHLFQLREMVEPSAAALAASSRSNDDLARITAAYADMERYKDGSGDLIGADLEFHQAILEATGNHFIGALGGLIHAALICSFELGWQGSATMQDDRMLQHRAVLDAIRDAEPDRAHSRMEVLLRESIDDVRRSLRRRARGRGPTRPGRSK